MGSPILLELKAWQASYWVVNDRTSQPAFIRPHYCVCSVWMPNSKVQGLHTSHHRSKQWHVPAASDLEFHTLSLTEATLWSEVREIHIKVNWYNLLVQFVGTAGFWHSYIWCKLRISVRHHSFCNAKIANAWFPKTFLKVDLKSKSQLESSNHKGESQQQWYYEDDLFDCLQEYGLNIFWYLLSN